MKITNKVKIALKSLLSIELAEVVTDKGVLTYDGELAEGVEVFVADENAEDGFAPAADGDYLLEDGRTLVVADGKVAEIKEKEETEEKPAEPTDEPTEPVEEAKMDEDTPAPIDEPTEPSNEETEEDRIAALEEKINAMTEGMNTLVNAIAALEERIAKAEEKLLAVEAPAAEPIDEKPVVEEERKSKMSYLRKK